VAGVEQAVIDTAFYISGGAGDSCAAVFCCGHTGGANCHPDLRLFPQNVYVDNKSWYHSRNRVPGIAGGIETVTALQQRMVKMKEFRTYSRDTEQTMLLCCTQTTTNNDLQTLLAIQHYVLEFSRQIVFTPDP
jgi:hypothetical protein